MRSQKVSWKESGAGADGSFLGQAISFGFPATDACRSPFTGKYLAENFGGIWPRSPLEWFSNKWSYHGCEVL